MIKVKATAWSVSHHKQNSCTTRGLIHAVRVGASNVPILIGSLLKNRGDVDEVPQKNVVGT
jgi:hypothetical protein